MEIRRNLTENDRRLNKLMNTYRFRQIVLWIMDVNSIFISVLVSKFLIINIKSIIVQKIILPIVVYITLHTILFTVCIRLTYKIISKLKIKSIPYSKNTNILVVSTGQ